MFGWQAINCGGINGNRESIGLVALEGLFWRGLSSTSVTRVTMLSDTVMMVFHLGCRLSLLLKDGLAFTHCGIKGKHQNLDKVVLEGCCTYSVTEAEVEQEGREGLPYFFCF
jgi:hypothetical protein